MLLLIIVVIFLLCLALYAIQILPLPGAPPFAKPFLQLMCIIIAFVVVAERAGLLSGRL